MKNLGITLTCISSLFILLTISFVIISNYKYEKEIGSYWSLADKSSTIEKKAENIDKFVSALQSSNLKGQFNAIVFITPDNGFDQNFESLKTLQTRLHEIKDMDVKSFEYQTAIQQITAQEQGEAIEMLDVFKGIWLKDNYIMLWNWICYTQVVISIIILIVGVVIWINEVYK